MKSGQGVQTFEKSTLKSKMTVLGIREVAKSEHVKSQLAIPISPNGQTRLGRLGYSYSMSSSVRRVCPFDEL